MMFLRGVRDTLRGMRTWHEVSQWLQPHLDGELDPSRTVQVEDHLATCERCGLEFETYSRIKNALHESSRRRSPLIGDEVALQRLMRFADQLVGHQRVEG